MTHPGSWPPPPPQVEILNLPFFFVSFRLSFRQEQQIGQIQVSDPCPTSQGVKRTSEWTLAKTQWQILQQEGGSNTAPE